MYEAFYGLRTRPFGKTPDPAFLFEGARHGEAMARLETAAADRDIALLVGEIGTGKTTLSRALVDRLGEETRVVLVINPRLSAPQMLAFIAERLGVEPLPKQKTRIIDAVTEKLFQIHEAGGATLVIVDEAHLIQSRQVFEELRLLTNLQLDDAPLLSLLLIGQPELKQKLAHPSLESFAQRIGMAYHLKPLDAEETTAYVVHRLQVAGREEPLFLPEALRAVYARSGGVPRRINTLCQSALLAGFGGGARRIDRAIIDDVWRDFEEHLGPLLSAAEPAAGAGKAGTWTS
jgi:general secretion pathway protein A